MYFYRGAALSVSTLNVASRAPGGYQHPGARTIAPEAPGVYLYRGAILSVNELNVASLAPGGYQHPGARTIAPGAQECISIRAPSSLLAP